MANRTISLSEDYLSIINGMRKSDPGFTLSGFVREMLDQDISYLTPEQIDFKIKRHEVSKEDMDAKIKHLKRVRPLAIERMELVKDTLKPKEDAIKVLKRKINETVSENEIIQLALVWQRLTDIDYKELIKGAKSD